MSELNSSLGRKQGRREFLKAGGAVTAALLAPVNFGCRYSSQKYASSCRRTPDASCDADAQSGQDRLQGRHLLVWADRPHSKSANNFDVAVPIVERALDLGVNYIDTSSIYGGPDRWSEQYVGKVMAHRRNEAFLATKTKERTREGSMRMIEKSLQLLQTDHVDLWQLHDIGTMTDVNQIFAKGGAMEALLEMQEQKVVRYLGVTGHYRPDALIEGINRHPSTRF